MNPLIMAGLLVAVGLATFAGSILALYVWGLREQVRGNHEPPEEDED